MDALAYIIGILGIVFFLGYVGFTLSERHTFLKIMSLFFAFLFMFFIPKVMIDFPPNCELVLDQSIANVTGNITTTNHTYTKFCSTGNDTATDILKNWFNVFNLILMYLTVFVFYWAIKKLQKNG